MAIVYVCVTYDNYDPDTGLFNMVQDCIPWNTDTQGSPPNGATPYATLTECYDQSECVNNVPTNSPDNWCGIEISSVSLIDRNNNEVTVSVVLPQQYCHTDIEYALFDSDDNILKDWTKIITPNKHLNAIDTYTVDVSLNGSSGSGSGGESCILGFRLVQPCLGSGSGGQRTLVPIEDAGAMGSIGAHWENNPRLESYPCSDGFDYTGISDIMNATLTTSTITDISISFLEDIGYLRSPGMIFDRCSWENIESTIIEDVGEVFESAASRWESYISYDPYVFNTISSQQNNTDDNDSSGGDGGDGGTGGDGGGTGGGGGNGGSVEESGDESGSGSGCSGEWNGLKLNALLETYSEENWAAMCSVDESITLGPVQINAISYTVVINSRFNNLSSSQWTSIITHELGHALGIGTLWQADIPECFWLTNDKYPKTSEAYNDLYYSNSGPCDDVVVAQYTSTSNSDVDLLGFKFECGCGKYFIK